MKLNAKELSRLSEGLPGSSLFMDELCDHYFGCPKTFFVHCLFLILALAGEVEFCISAFIFL